MKLSNPFKKKKIRIPSTYAVIRFKESMKEMGVCVSGDIGKEIIVMQNGTVVNFYPCSYPYIKMLENDMGVPVIDLTERQMKPTECEKRPAIVYDLGIFEFRR